MTMPAPHISAEPFIKAGHILIVDDEQLNRELFADILSFDYNPVAVSSGRAALEYLENNDVDLVLLDLMMPGMDGFTVLEKIRETRSQTDLPVVIVSAMAENDYVVRGFNMGANDYVAKPITPSVLMARVQTQLMVKKMHDERLLYINTLEEAEQLRIRLTHIASHDLKNPLNNIKIAHVLLKNLVETTGNPKLAQVLDSLKLNVETMRYVIDTFLDMVAIQTNSLEFKEDVFAMRDVAMNVITQYEMTADKKNIVISHNDLEGFVIGDNSRTLQAVTNIVSNAIKYSPENTLVHVATEEHPTKIRLTVRDSGPGIPKAERTLLFKEFSKLSTRPTAGEESTGLGLWIVKQLMEAQGGAVGADFPDEGGSIFWIELPKTSPPKLENGSHNDADDDDVDFDADATIPMRPIDL